MARPPDAATTSTLDAPSGLLRSLRGALPRRPGPAGRASLARRFLLANLVILLVVGVVVGVWVGDQLERGIVDRTAAVTALYVDSIIEPSVTSMADGEQLTAEEIAELDELLDTTTLTEGIVSLRLWSHEGQVVYSTTSRIIGKWFPVEDKLAEAWQGSVAAGMDDLSGAENEWERANFNRLLEMYIPVRERGSDRIIAVAEFYQDPTDIDRQVSEARLTSWLVVSLAIVVSAVLLFGIVKQGSDTIERQDEALSRQVDELTALLARNAALNERVRSAAERTTTLNERSMRRISSDLHDGPGQMLSLALLRLDALRSRAAGGRAPEAEEMAQIESVLKDAMTDMRALAAGLRLPELEGMAPADVAGRAIADHERRSGTTVGLELGDVPDRAALPVKIALFRALQEALSNATRHGQGTDVLVSLAAVPGERGTDERRLVLGVDDAGPGFDTGEIGLSQGLGLAGIREQAELLGGGFSIDSRPGAGTRLRAWWPIA